MPNVCGDVGAVWWVEPCDVSLFDVSKIFSHHTTNILKEAQKRKEPEPQCNCRQKDSCQLKGKCLTKGVVYQAAVTTTDTNGTQNYVGLTETTFKTRYKYHTSSFRNRNKKNTTELSKHIWSLTLHYQTYTTLTSKICLALNRVKY